MKEEWIPLIKEFTYVNLYIFYNTKIHFLTFSYHKKLSPIYRWQIFAVNVLCSIQMRHVQTIDGLVSGKLSLRNTRPWTSSAIPLLTFRRHKREIARKWIRHAGRVIHTPLADTWPGKQFFAGVLRRRSRLYVYVYKCIYIYIHTHIHTRVLQHRYAR